MQDVSSMLVVEAAGIRPGDTVIDVCAAPGGKALHAAAKLNGTGEVIACDVSRYKTDKIEESLTEIQTLQREIIANVIDYIKPGGTLMYSTCTMNPGENEEMAAWICETFGLEPVDMKDRLPAVLAGEGKQGMLQLLPGVHETDGFFLAKLRKK